MWCKCSGLPVEATAAAAPLRSSCCSLFCLPQTLYVSVLFCFFITCFIVVLCAFKISLLKLLTRLVLTHIGCLKFKKFSSAFSLSTTITFGPLKFQSNN